MLCSLKSWHDYFVENSSNKGGISWDDVDTLTAEEKKRIEKSIATFQLGEYSEGRGLLRFATEYANKNADDHLIKITRLFIAEEQNHARLLKSFMDRHEIAAVKKNWTDTVFRRLRKNVGYELSITVLITAEIISLVYYRALKNCTGSRLLAKVCDKLLADESAHIRYESELIIYIRNSRSAPVSRLIGLLHRTLFMGTTLVVYLEHREVIRGGGYGLLEFWAACQSEFSGCFTPAEIVQASQSA
ncbi:MAG TPA: hypothetical protein VNH22_16565 [Blastocatellia bacterium]|jgi:hypothetical protein|nr:hypothetical protein [Blastocatellia bacterium]